MLHRDIRATVAEGIHSELHDLVLDAFRNHCQMTADKILRFNPLRCSVPDGCVAGSNRFDYSSGEDSSDKGGS